MERLGAYTEREGDDEEGEIEQASTAGVQDPVECELSFYVTLGSRRGQGGRTYREQEESDEV